MHRLATLLVFSAAGALAANAPAILHSFGANGSRGGSDLYSGLILDSAGDLYGATESGGTFNAGVIYKLARAAGGGWSETVLYNFKGTKHQDGASPHATLMWDGAGNLYGTTVSGGLTGSNCRTGCGTVFKLAPAAGGWQETVLYRFTGEADGSVPYPGVVMDAGGNLYGATTNGGAAEAGTAYKLTPGTGGWTYVLLHTFEQGDGAAPYGTPILDAAGNLYGTTNSGGIRGKGAVWELSPQSNGSWTVQVLHSFLGGADGVGPLAGVIFDRKGNLYGTTSIGGTANCGVAFRLVPDGKGGWGEKILHTFLGVTAQDPENPNGLTLDSAGDLYGTSTGGGVYNPGTIFKLTHGSNGWQETVLYSFTGGNDGAYPITGLTIDAAGHLFGTTLWGGPVGDTSGGVAFEFTP